MTLKAWAWNLISMRKNKCDEWAESQNEEDELIITEEMVRNTGDEYIDLLWELLDKMKEMKGKIEKLNQRKMKKYKNFSDE